MWKAWIQSLGNEWIVEIFYWPNSVITVICFSLKLAFYNSHANNRQTIDQQKILGCNLSSYLAYFILKLYAEKFTPLLSRWIKLDQQRKNETIQMLNWRAFFGELYLEIVRSKLGMFYDFFSPRFLLFATIKMYWRYNPGSNKLQSTRSWSTFNYSAILLRFLRKVDLEQKLRSVMLDNRLVC